MNGFPNEPFDPESWNSENFRKKKLISDARLSKKSLLGNFGGMASENLRWIPRIPHSVRKKNLYLKRDFSYEYKQNNWKIFIFLYTKERKNIKKKISKVIILYLAGCSPRFLCISGVASMTLLKLPHDLFLFLSCLMFQLQT